MYKLVKIESSVRVLPVLFEAKESEDKGPGGDVVKEITPEKNIERHICEIRGKKVMLDSDIAELYGVEVKRLNEQVKRNRERFPVNYMFQLTPDEAWIIASSRPQFATLKRGQNIKYMPNVFTEFGVVMLSSVLNSLSALKMSFAVVESFIRLRKLAEEEKENPSKITEHGIKLLLHDKKLEEYENSTNSVIGHMIGIKNKKKQEKKYGFETDESGKIIKEEQNAAIYGQQH